MIPPMTPAPSIKEALERLIADIEDYERVNNLAPSPGKKDCWQSVTNAKAALATFQPDGEKREAIALDFHTGDETPDVKRGSYAGFIVVTENDNGKHFAFAGYYLNAYPLDYGDSCPKGDGCHGDGCDDGCPTTGWFYDESNFEYENCYYPISTKVVRWAPIPKADAILASGLVQDEAGIRQDERESDEAAVISQHIAWLRVYMDEMTPKNWKDMNLRARRKIDELAAAIRSARDGGAES